MKRCPECGAVKPLTDFYPRHIKVGGRNYESVQPRCKACTAKVIRAYRAHLRKAK